MQRFYILLVLILIFSCTKGVENESASEKEKQVDLKVMIHPKDLPENLIYLFTVSSDSLTTVDFNKTTAKDFKNSWRADTSFYELKVEEVARISSLLNTIPSEEDIEIPLNDATELRIIIDGNLRFHRTAFGKGMQDSHAVDELLDLLSQLSGVKIWLFGYTD